MIMMLRKVLKPRHKEFKVNKKIVISQNNSQKMTIYADLLKSMIIDQIKYLRDKNHQRVISDENGYNSLLMAVNATKMI